MNEEKQKRYNIYIDFIRIIAILGVILIHITTRTLEAGGFHTAQQQLTLFLNQTARFAVPMFFLISGFVLEVNYSLHTSYIRYLKKRVDRLLLPYCFWSCMYYFFVYTHHSDNFLTALLNGSASYQLYFIPALLIFYLIFPFLHRLYGFISNIWVIFILGIIQMLFLYFDYYLHAIYFFYPLAIVLLNFYIFLLGIFLSHHQKKFLSIIRKWRLLIGLITPVLASIVFYEGMYFYQRTGNYLFIYSQWRISIFLYTLFLSALLYGIATYCISYAKIIKKVSSLSFFVFFIHVIILEFVWSIFSSLVSLQVRTWIIHQIWFDGLFFLTIVCVSFFIAFIAHKIPKLRLVTG